MRFKSTESDAENQDRRPMPRSENPLFGEPNHYGNRNSAMLIDNDGYVPSSQDNFDYRGGSHKPTENYDEMSFEELKERILEANEILRHQSQEHKTQMLHTETINMMTKYQLVFIKLETVLLKLVNLAKVRESTALANGFKLIRECGSANSSQDRMKKLIYFKNAEFKLRSMTKVINNCRKRVLAASLRSIVVNSLQARIQYRHQREKEQLKRDLEEGLGRRDAELSRNNKKIEEYNSIITNLKGKEVEQATKIKQLDKVHANLETLVKGNKPDLRRPESAQDLRHLIQKIKELQAENSALRDRVSSAEFNVSNFIKEMSEMLDPHELSTNIGSEDNSTILPVYQHVEPLEAYEEFEPMSKGREPSSLKAAQYDSSKRTLENLIQSKTASTTKHTTSKPNKFHIH